MNQVLDTFFKSIDAFSDEIAVDEDGRPCTYSELGALAQDVRRQLQAASGEHRLRIGFYMRNSTGYLAAYFGAMAGGHLPLLIDRSMARSELASIVDTCGVTHVIVGRSELAKLPLDDVTPVRPLAGGTVLVVCKQTPAHRPPALDTTVTCRFTSGSNGIPKCLEFSDTAIVSAARNWADGTRLRSGERTLCLAALSNGLAFNTSLLATFVAGGTLHFYNGLMMAAGVWDVVTQKNISRLVGFPAIYKHLSKLGRPARRADHGLTLAISSSAALSPHVRGDFLDTFGLRIADYYGIAETGPVTFETDPRVNRGLGRPLPGVSLRIAPQANGRTGPIQVKTASMASRYLNHPGAFEARLTPDGFFRADDQGYLSDRRLFITGKSGKTANIGGRNVHASEVTFVLERQPSVADAEVFVDQDGAGEDILHAVVVAKPGLNRTALVTYCRSELAGYKVPARFTFVDRIPRSAVGKASLRALKQLTAEPDPL